MHLFCLFTYTYAPFARFFATQKGHQFGVLFVLIREASSDSAPRLCLGTSGDRALASSAVRRRILLFFYLRQTNLTLHCAKKSAVLPLVSIANRKSKSKRKQILLFLLLFFPICFIQPLRPGAGPLKRRFPRRFW